MDERFFTVDEIAEMLNLHTKTIQRYIREGKLKANKIGKSWRISGHDLSIFTEIEHETIEINNHEKTLKKTQAERVKISAVADIIVYGIDDAMRIINMVNGGLNSKSSDFGESTVQTQYIEKESKVRVMLWGTPGFMEIMMSMISMIAKEGEIDE